MKQGAIIKAYRALNKLSQQDLPIRLAFDLFRIRQALQPQWDFQVSEENKATAGATVDASGNVSFADPAAAEACRERLRELMEIDVDLTVSPAQIPLNTPGLRLSIDDVDALSGLVNFTSK